MLSSPIVLFLQLQIIKSIDLQLKQYMLAGFTNVTFEFGARTIIEDATWHIQPNERIGLIGYNGTGKSTMLKLFVGEYQPSEGTVEKSRDTSIGYLHQDLLSFDSDNRLISKRKLHANLITTDYGRQEEGKEIAGAMHNHLPETGDFITPTDICTLMLYEKRAGWKNYTVLSSRYFSLWNCETNTLVAITREAMEKIIKDQEKRHKKNH